MARRIGFVANPNAAGHRRWADRIPSYRALMKDRGLFRETRSIEELPEVARSFLQEGIDILAVAGGDGTLHAVLNAFLPVFGSNPFPSVLILQAGTINNLSSEIGMRRQGLEILRGLLMLWEEDRFRKAKRTLMRINGEYGFLYGSGFPARFLRRYYQGSRRGLKRALKVIGASILWAALWPERAGDLFERIQARITVDGSPKGKKELLFVLASTILKIGLNFRPCYRARAHPEAFHLMACSSPPLQLLRRIHRIYFGRPLSLRGCEEDLARHVVIDLDEPLPYMIDGELKGPSSVHRLRIDREIPFIVETRS